MKFVIPFLIFFLNFSNHQIHCWCCFVIYSYGYWQCCSFTLASFVLSRLRNGLTAVLIIMTKQSILPRTNNSKHTLRTLYQVWHDPPLAISMAMAAMRTVVMSKPNTDIHRKASHSILNFFSCTWLTIPVIIDGIISTTKLKAKNLKTLQVWIAVAPPIGMEMQLNTNKTIDHRYAVRKLKASSQGGASLSGSVFPLVRQVWSCNLTLPRVGR